jgi:drug/metabolite transporter (DMT)-like permease
MKSAQRSYRLGLVLVIVAVVAWSTSGLFTRLIAADTPTILFWRGLFGALGTAIVLAIIPGARRPLGRVGLAYAAVTALSMLLFISALRNTSVAHVAVITAGVPFIAAALGWVVLREAPGLSAVIASTAALVGVAIMVGLGSDGGVLGDALAVLMAIGMAAMIVISRRHDVPALSATCLASALCALAVLPFATLTTVTPQDLSLLVLFALVNQVLGFGLFALGAKLLPPIQTALITALEAPLAPLWVWLILSETPGQSTLAGGTIVLVAVVGHTLWVTRQVESEVLPKG